MTRKLGLLAGVAAVALMAAPAMAQQAGVRGNRAGDFLIGASVLGVLPTNNGGGVSTAPVTGQVSASNAWTGQLDFTYFMTNNISVNLIAATTRHDLTVQNMAAGGAAIGSTSLGHVWALPPTLTVQYHPVSGIRLDPYVGIGLNYTWFYNESGYRGNQVGTLAGTQVTSLNVQNAFGVALNAGLNYELTPNWLLNLDFKYLFLRPNATVGTNIPGLQTVRASAWLDPVVFAVGIRYRF